MHEERRKLQEDVRESTFQRIEKIHPFKMILVLGMVGSSMLFLFMIIAYIATVQADTNIELPKAFILSTIFLIISSFCISNVLDAYDDDDMKKLVKALGFTLILSIAFVICQLLGWQQLNDWGFYLSEKGGAPYLYIISGLHVFHLIVGMGVLAVLLIRWHATSRDPVKVLIQVTNPYQRLKLELLTLYWHFIDVLWVVLFFFFLFFF